MTLIDRFGREIRTNKPITDEIAVAGIRDRYSTYPSHGLTPERLATILKEADAGDVYRQAELFEEMEEKDGHLASVLQTRKLAISGLSWEILPASDSAEDKKIAIAAKEVIEYIENWEDGLLDILDAIGKGFSVNEIMWEISEGHAWIKTLEWVHQKKFTFSSQNGLVLKTPRLLTDESPIWGEELLPNKFVFFRHHARSGAAPRGGLCRPCAYMYLFKNYDIKHWLIFNELFSVPMRVGKYKAGASKDEIEKLKQAVYNLGVDAAAVISDSTVIELIESKLRGDVSSFSKFIEFCDKTESKIVLGHTGSSESTPGRLGGEDEAKDVRQDLKEADAKALEKAIKFQIISPWVLYNYGPTAGVPKFNLRYETPEDMEKTAKVYGILVKDAGFKGIGANHIHEKFGIPKPTAGEDVLGVVSAEASVKTQSNKCTCGHHSRASLMVNTSGSPDDEWITKYMERLTPSLKGAKDSALKEIESWLHSLSAPPSFDELNEKIQRILGEAFQNIDRKAFDNTISELYAFYKIKDVLTQGIEIAFGGADVRAVDFLAKLDHFYASKFIRNPETIESIKSFIQTQYLESGSGLFGRGSAEDIQKFKVLLDQKVGELSDYQVRRIVDTGVQRTRNWAHVAQMHDAGIAEIEIYEPTMDCSFCQSMNGKIIRVDIAYMKMTEQTAMSPEQYEAEFERDDNKPTLDNIESFVNRGLLPPYHPHCHGRIMKRIKR